MVSFKQKKKKILNFDLPQKKKLKARAATGKSSCMDTKRKWNWKTPRKIIIYLAKM